MGSFEGGAVVGAGDAMDALDLVLVDQDTPLQGAADGQRQQQQYPRSAAAPLGSSPVLWSSSSSPPGRGESPEAVMERAIASYKEGQALLRKKEQTVWASAALKFLDGARGGHVASVCALGGCYERGDGGVDANPRRAVALYLKAAGSGGSVRAMFALGRCYEHGTGTVASAKRAETWYLAGCCLARKRLVSEVEATSHPPSTEAAPSSSSSPSPPSKTSVPKPGAAEPRPNTGRRGAAEEAARQASRREGQRDIGAGCFALGLMFERIARGRGGRHADLMARWYAKAAWVGHAKAMGRLAAHYEAGSCGMERRPAVAAAWLRQAVRAEKGGSSTAAGAASGAGARPTSQRRDTGQQTSKTATANEKRLKRLEDAERVDALLGRPLVAPAQPSDGLRPTTAPSGGGRGRSRQTRPATLRELVDEVIDLAAERAFDRLVQDEFSSRVTASAGDWAVAIDTDLARGDGLYRLVEMTSVGHLKENMGSPGTLAAEKTTRPASPTADALVVYEGKPRPATATTPSRASPRPPPGTLRQFVAEGKTRLEASGGARWAEAEAVQVKRALSARQATRCGFRPGDWRRDPTYRAIGKAYDKRSKMMQEFRLEIIAAEKLRTLRALKELQDREDDAKEGRQPRRGG